MLLEQAVGKAPLARRRTRAVLRDFLELDLFGKDHQIVLGRAAGTRTVLPAEVHEHIIALMQIDEAFPLVGMDLAEKNGMILMENDLDGEPLFHADSSCQL